MADVLSRQIIQQTPALTYERQETCPGVDILLVLAEMVCKFLDPIGEDRYLNLCRPCVAVVLLKVLYYLGLSFLIQNPSWTFSFLLPWDYNTAQTGLQRRMRIGFSCLANLH